MVFDSARSRVVLFGGSAGGTDLGDTWEYNGTTWFQRTSTNSPSARTDSAMAFDSVRNRTVLFGGGGALSGTVLSDLWEWDGTNWTQPTAMGTPPPAYRGHAMVFDTSRARTVLYGGGGGPATYQTSVWEWSGTTWTQPGAAGAGPPRERAAMAFDSRRAKTVMFGGYVNLGSPVYLDETWEWNGTAFTQVNLTGTRPTVRRQHAMAYDSVRGKVVMFGGVSSTARNSQTWEFGP